MACFGCTQGSNLGGRPVLITPEEFELACQSLAGYWGVVGMFGGNPATHPRFLELCDILAKYFPFDQRGLWCNNPLGHGTKMRSIFNPAVSNLNVHTNREAYDEFRRDWPESMPFGLEEDSRHSPPFVAMQDVMEDEQDRWELIANCDINRYWSAMVCYIPGKGLRAFFCELAGAQAMLHANDPNWPDLGLEIPCPTCKGNGKVLAYRGEPSQGKELVTCPECRDSPWWKRPMEDFARQVRYHCHRCGIPLRRFGQLAVGGEFEEVSKTHADIYNPKRKGRPVQLIEIDNGKKLSRVTDYVPNGSL